MEIKGKMRDRYDYFIFILPKENIMYTNTHENNLRI